MQLKLKRGPGKPVIFDATIDPAAKGLTLRPVANSTVEKRIGDDVWTIAQFLRIRDKPLRDLLLAISDVDFKNLVLLIAADSTITASNNYRRFRDVASNVIAERFLGIAI